LSETCRDWNMLTHTPPGTKSRAAWNQWKNGLVGRKRGIGSWGKPPIFCKLEYTISISDLPFLRTLVSLSGISTSVTIDY
jgi:hypothetical protein